MSKNLKLFDNQIKSYAEFEYKTEKSMNDLRAKCNRLHRVLQSKKKFLTDLGVNKHKINKASLGQKFSLAKTNFEKSMLGVKDEQTSASKIVFKPMTVVNKSNLKLNPSVNEPENEEDDDEILRQIDLKQYNSGNSFLISNAPIRLGIF